MHGLHALRAGRRAATGLFGPPSSTGAVLGGLRGDRRGDRDGPGERARGESLLGVGGDVQRAGFPGGGEEGEGGVGAGGAGVQREAGGGVGGGLCACDEGELSFCCGKSVVG